MKSTRINKKHIGILGLALVMVVTFACKSQKNSISTGKIAKKVTVKAVGNKTSTDRVINNDKEVISDDHELAQVSESVLPLTAVEATVPSQVKQKQAFQPASNSKMVILQKLLENATLISSTDSAADEDGSFERTKFFQTSLKYPKILVVEKVSASGEVIGSEEMAADHMIVKIAQGASENDLVQINEKYGAKILQKTLAPNTYLISFEAHDSGTLSKMMASYSKEAAKIAYAEQDSMAYPLNVPNDPQIGSQWGVNITHSPEAWDLHTGGSNVMVGVVDTGINYMHPDLAANVWTNPGETGLDAQGRDKATNGIDDDGNGFVDDVHGWNFANGDNDVRDDDDVSHGTHCSGIIGAVGNNGIGVSGVCWNVKLVALKVFTQKTGGFMSDFGNAIWYGTKMGVKLTSNSWRGGASQILTDGIQDAQKHDILFVAAAGNDGTNMCVMPAALPYDNVISVAATDSADRKASFSNYDATSVDLGAPGVGVLSTYRTSSYANLSGTSMATPYVAGACALMMSKSPQLNYAAIKKALFEGTDPIPALAGKCVTGGRLNVFKALQGAMSAENTPTVITKQPVNQQVRVGYKATFTVVAAGTNPISYQWKKNGVSISGATGPSYTTPATVAGDDGAAFAVVITSPVGSITSNSVKLIVDIPITSITNPVAQTVNVGKTATFKVATNGNRVSYQWYKGYLINGVLSSVDLISGATSSSYTTPVTIAEDNGLGFFAHVSNICGASNSGAAKLTVLTVGGAPTIATQPASKTVNVGQTAAFSVVAAGTAPFTYQWKKNGVEIPGATAVSYTTPAAVWNDNGSIFTVVVSNAVGTVTSGNKAALTVNTVPIITTQLANTAVNAGKTATFSIVATGTNPISYQWKKNGVNIGSLTSSSSYTTPATVIGDNGTVYSVVINNPNGSVTSANATLTVIGSGVAPSITTQPVAQVVTAGQTATFSVAVVGSTPLTYQWRKNGANISGATAASYKTPATVAGDNGAAFSVVVSNPMGSVTSNDATLTVNVLPPSITTQPVAQTVGNGQTATFTVVASGTATLNYQWMKNGANILYATKASYTTPAVGAADNGAIYSVTVRNAYGTVTSVGAKLSVNAPPLPPSNLAARTISSSQIDLQWTDSASNEAGFKIERKSGIHGSYIQIGAASANDTVYHDVTAVSGVQYFYRACATNSYGDSVYSNEVTIISQAIFGALAGGSTYSLALKDDGTVWSCGGNGYGQLGLGHTNQMLIATQVTGISGHVVEVASGNYHSMAITDDGRLWVWGYNYYGQLGDGTTLNQVSPVVNIAIPGRVHAVEGGSGHTVAITESDGAIWAWGYNAYGQLGNGNKTGQKLPVKITGFSGVATEVAAGSYHTLALRNDGTVWSWGYNASGQLGIGNTTSVTVPTQVVGISNVIHIAAGDNFSMAITSDGKIWTWGANSYGQLGDGTTTQQMSPVQVPGLDRMIAVVGGSNHTQALKEDGTVWAWGYNYYGQLGDGTKTQRLTPGRVKNLDLITGIDAGTSHNLVLKLDGSVYGWGGNGSGQLGNGSIVNATLPSQMVGLDLILE